MVKRLSSKKLLAPSDFSPTADGFEILGVFNPGAARMGADRGDSEDHGGHGNEIVLLVRVAQSSVTKEDGWLHSPRSVLAGGGIRYEIDRLEIHPDDDGDYRKPLTMSGHRRLAFISHLELIRLSPDGYEVREIVRHDELFGRTAWEEYGVEDPRITRIEGTYWITYVGVSEQMGVATQLMSTKDFRSFERHGVILPCENKDAVLFPEKVAGSYRMYHRPVGAIGIRDLAILTATSPDLLHWGGHAYVLGSSADPGWYSRRIGAGTPPVRTGEGWLSIFHGVELRGPGDKIGVYTAGAMLTALEEPAKVIALSEEPFFKAEEEFEVSGYVRDVVFPTGIVRDLEDPDRLHVYYGCADSCVAVTTFSEREILSSLRRL